MPGHCAGPVIIVPNEPLPYPNDTLVPAVEKSPFD